MVDTSAVPPECHNCGVALVGQVAAWLDGGGRMLCDPCYNELINRIIDPDHNTAIQPICYGCDRPIKGTVYSYNSGTYCGVCYSERLTEDVFGYSQPEEPPKENRQRERVTANLRAIRLLVDDTLKLYERGEVK